MPLGVSLSLKRQPLHHRKEVTAICHQTLDPVSREVIRLLHTLLQQTLPAEERVSSEDFSGLYLSHLVSQKDCELQKIENLSHANV